MASVLFDCLCVTCPIVWLTGARRLRLPELPQGHSLAIFPAQPLGSLRARPPGICHMHPGLRIAVLTSDRSLWPGCHKSHHGLGQSPGPSRSCPPSRQRWTHDSNLVFIQLISLSWEGWQIPFNSRPTRPKQVSKGSQFNMLPIAEVLSTVQPSNWATSTDTYFHVPVAAHYQPFLWFAFQGHHCQFRVFLFGLSLSPRIFIWCVAARSQLAKELSCRHGLSTYHSSTSFHICWGIMC